MKNKEVIDKLEEYFLKQDPKVIARALAATMIDIHRICNIDSLELQERASLVARSKANSLELEKFIEHGSNDKFTLTNVENL